MFAGGEVDLYECWKLMLEICKNNNYKTTIKICFVFNEDVHWYTGIKAIPVHLFNITQFFIFSCLCVYVFNVPSSLH